MSGSKKTKKIELPAEIWVMSMSGFTPIGSFSHVSSGDKFFATREECQNEIDNMPGWLGMGDRSRYHPLRLVSRDE